MQQKYAAQGFTVLGIAMDEEGASVVYPSVQKERVDVDGANGKLEVMFEEPEKAKFVDSPNAPVREIWISALSTSFKLGWSDSKNGFTSEKTADFFSSRRRHTRLQGDWSSDVCSSD